MYTYMYTYGKELLQTIQCSEATLIIACICYVIERMCNTCPG